MLKKIIFLFLFYQIINAAVPSIGGNALEIEEFLENSLAVPSDVKVNPVQSLPENEELDLLIYKQARLFLKQDYGNVVDVKGNTKGICVFTCKIFGCKKVMKQEVIRIEEYYHERCPPVKINGGSECPCFYLLPLAGQKKGLDKMKQLTQHLANVCKSSFVCQNEDNTPAITYLDRYFATKNKVTVTGFNHAVVPNKPQEEVMLKEEEVPEEVQIIQTIVEQTTNNPKPPLLGQIEPKCPNIPYKFDVIGYSSAEELRQRALKRCKHDDKWIYYSCMFDSARGIHKTKEEYEEVAKFVKSKYGSGNKMCYSSGDPHYKDFHGRRFNIYGVQAKKRVLYAKSELTVATDISYSRRWGHRGLNTGVYVNYKDKSFSILVPSNRRWNNPKVVGFKVTKTYYRSLRRFIINVHQSTIRIDVNINGYANIYITVPAGESINCKGDCCERHTGNTPAKLSNITFGLGDPEAVPFKSACYRKAKHVEICSKKHTKFTDQFKCVKEYAFRN